MKHRPINPFPPSRLSVAVWRYLKALSTTAFTSGLSGVTADTARPQPSSPATVTATIEMRTRREQDALRLIICSLKRTWKSPASSLILGPWLDANGPQTDCQVARATTDPALDLSVLT